MRLRNKLITKKFKLNPGKFKLTSIRFNFKKSLATTTVIAISVLGIFNFTDPNFNSQAVGETPNISSLNPNKGLTTGNTEVEIAGTNFFAEKGIEIVEMSAGYNYSLAIDTDGNLYAWGGDYRGQLGNGTSSNADVTSPQLINDGSTAPGGSGIPTTTKFKAISVSPNSTSTYVHSLAIDTDGNLYAWGYNCHGQIGNGTINYTVASPQLINDGSTAPGGSGIPTTTKFKAISAGARHSLAIDTDGNLYAWGYDYNGELGNGTSSNADVTSPQLINDGSTAPGGSGIPISTKFNQIASGYHSLAIDTDGNLYTWGSDSYGQLGNGTSSSATVTSPQLINDGSTVPGGSGIPTTTKFKDIAANESHSLAIDTAGNLYAWGFDSTGEIGNGTTVNNTCTIDNLSCSLSPQLINDGSTAPGGSGIPTTTKFKDIATGSGYSLAIDTAGNLYAWGYDVWGQLGNGTSSSATVTSPQLINDGSTAPGGSGIPTTTKFKAISAGDSHSLAIDTDGNLYTWGRDYNGQLGNGTSSSADVASPQSIMSYGSFAPKSLANISSVTFGGTEAISFTVNSDTSITAITPAHTAGVVNVVVTTPDSIEGSLVDGYTYYLGPVINNVLPNTGISGTDITITGENFGNLVMGSGTPTNFSTCGTPQVFTAPKDGTYKLETWGAQGGKTSTPIGGKGGYSTGEITLTKDETLYIYVGCQPTAKTGGWNGGGDGGTYNTNTSYGGGGATDIRTVQNADPLDTTSLQSRIIVAGGGGGGAQGGSPSGSGGAGGGTTGIDGSPYSSSYSTTGGKGATQSAGGVRGTYSNDTYSGFTGELGKGGNGGNGSDSYLGGGGGGGYYGGGGGASYYGGSGGGGSGYVDSSLTNILTVDGSVADSIPNPNGGAETGHSGNGYARIAQTDAFLNTVTLDSNGTPADCEITSWTDTEIHCLTSDHELGLVDIELFNGVDTAYKEDVFTYEESAIELSLETDSNQVVLKDSSGSSTINPTSTGTFVSASNTANVITNNVLGYNLSISTDKPSTDTNASNMEHLSLPGNYLLATTNTCTWNSTTKILTNTTTSLSNNTWGFTLNNTNLTNQQLCKVPNQTSPLTIKQTTTPTDQDTGDDTTIFYGSKIDTNQVAGQYEARVLYTGVVNI